MKLIAFITEPITIRALLMQGGEPIHPPPLAARARVPPELELAHTAAFAFDQSPEWEHGAITAGPRFQFDQTVAP